MLYIIHDRNFRIILLDRKCNSKCPNISLDSKSLCDLYPKDISNNHVKYLSLIYV